MCLDTSELVDHPLFKEIVNLSVRALMKRDSIILDIFDHKNRTILEEDIKNLIKTLRFLVKLPVDQVVKIIPEAEPFLKHKRRFSNYIDYLYDFWRSFDRFIISRGTNHHLLEKRPYRTFNTVIEDFNRLVRQTYRDIHENITYEYPNIYRQIQAGAAFATIAVPMDIPIPLKYSKKVSNVKVMRQVMLNPPIVLDPPMNKRTGKFLKVEKNPIDLIDIKYDDWLCYPVKVGELTILTYIHEMFYELGFSMANLYKLATDEDLMKKPDGLFFFGVQNEEINHIAKYPTVFHDDEENNMLIGAIPGKPKYGYFGYLKKMLLSLHNVKMLHKLRLPFHGSLIRILMEGGKDVSILFFGDCGAGEEETLEAMMDIFGNKISDVIIIADDMGSLDIDDDMNVIGYGTEVGSFIRLDDLAPSAKFGAIDRAIFMKVDETNSRVVIPTTTMYNVNRGTKIDMVLYTNNYEEVDEDHPVIELFDKSKDALGVLRRGCAMSMGATTATGLQETYFVNPFGVPEYPELHDKLAQKFFNLMESKGVFLGEFRTQLGIEDRHRQGPYKAARSLVKFIESNF